MVTRGSLAVVFFVVSLVAPVGLAPTSAAAPAFVGLAPARVLETRANLATVDGAANGLGLRDAGSITEVQITGRAQVPLSTTAVSVNVTATEPRAAGFLTLFPCGSERPNASSLNYAAGQTIANNAIAKLDSRGALCVFTLAASHIVLDVNGYFTSGGDYRPVSPARLLESRPALATVDGRSNGIGLRSAGSSTPVVAAGRADVPANASAVAVNITVTEPQAAGFVTAFPCGAERPNASTLNYASGQTIANGAVVMLGTDGALCLFTLSTTHLLLDVTGYFTDGGSYRPLQPARVADTRLDGTTSDGSCRAMGRLRGASEIRLPVLGRGGVPTTGVGAVVLTVTATEPRRDGFVTAYPNLTARPNASNLNFATSDLAVANTTIATVGTDGAVALFSNASTHLVVDVVGWIPGAVSAPASDCSGRFIRPIAELSTLRVGDFEGCAVVTGGTVKCWRVDTGTGTFGAPAAVSGVTGAVEIAGGFSEGWCVRTTTGQITCWGYTGLKGAPQEPATTIIPSRPATHISHSLYLTCSINTSGPLTCWSPYLIGENEVTLPSPPVSFEGTRSGDGLTSTMAVAVRLANGQVASVGLRIDGSPRLSVGSGPGPYGSIGWPSVAARRPGTFNRDGSTDCVVLNDGRATCDPYLNDLSGGREVIQNTGLYIASSDGVLSRISYGPSFLLNIAAGAQPELTIPGLVGVSNTSDRPVSVTAPMAACALNDVGTVSCWIAATGVPSPTTVLTDALVP